MCGALEVLHMLDIPDVLARRPHILSHSPTRWAVGVFAYSAFPTSTSDSACTVRNEEPFSGPTESGSLVPWSRGTAFRRRRVVFDRKTRSVGGVDGHHNQCFRVDDERDGESAAESENAQTGMDIGPRLSPHGEVRQLAKIGVQRAHVPVRRFPRP